jgi:hypothetical protein
MNDLIHSKQIKNGINALSVWTGQIHALRKVIMETTNELTNELTTKKGIKESANYDVESMEFTCGGIRRKYTFDKENVEKLHGSVRKLILIGARNTVQDSTASLTIKSGFTNEQRLSKMNETLNALNEGKFTERVSSPKNSISLSTFNDITGIDEIKLLVKMHVPLNAVQKAILEKTLDDMNMENGENSQG